MLRRHSKYPASKVGTCSVQNAWRQRWKMTFFLSLTCASSPRQFATLEERRYRLVSCKREERGKGEKPLSPLENTFPEFHFPILTCAPAVEAKASAASSADAKRGARRRMIPEGHERAEPLKKTLMKTCVRKSYNFSVGTWANW